MTLALALIVASSALAQVKADELPRQPNARINPRTNTRIKARSLAPSDLALFRLFKGGAAASGSALTGSKGEVITFARSSTGYAATDAGVLASYATNVPRITGGGLLIERSRENILLQSSAFNNAQWQPAAFSGGTAPPVVTANNATAPDGTLTAETIAFTAHSSGISYITNSPILQSGQRYTVSGYMRATAGSGNINLGFTSYGGSGGGKNCTVTTTWQRCTYTITAAATATHYLSLGYDQRIPGVLPIPTINVEVWNFQVENDAYPTSPVTTGSSSATRAEDSVSFPNPLSGTAPTKWSISMHATPLGDAWAQTNDARAFFSFGGYLDNNAASALIVGAYDAGNQGKIVFNVRNATGGERSVTTSAAVPANARTFAFKSNAGVLTIEINGEPVSTVLGGTGNGIISSHPSTVHLGRLGGQPNARVNAIITDVAIHNTF